MNKTVLILIAFLTGLTGQGWAQSSPEQTSGPSLKVSTVERQPFIFVREDGKVDGFSADLWTEIAKQNSWNFKWQVEDSFPEMIKQVKSAASNVAVANISITAAREKIIDFSHPIYDSGMQIIVPDKRGGIGFLTLIWRSGALQMIGAAVIILLIIAHLLWFFERETPNKRHDYFRDDYFGGIWDAFWWAFIVMTMGGFENEVPHSVLSRVLAMFWIVVSLFFVSILTAKITTSLTVEQLTGDINSYQDLVGKKVGVGRDSAMSKFLDVKNIRYRKYKDFKKALAAVEKGEIDATIADAPVAKYYVAHEGSGKVLLAGPVFQPDKFGIALPSGSKLLEQINTSLLELKENGIYERLTIKWFGAAQ